MLSRVAGGRKPVSRVSVHSLLRRLRRIETGLETALGIAQVQAFQSELEKISRAAQLFPMLHTDLFFSLRGHINRVRGQVASRLVEEQSQTAQAT